MSFRKFVLTLLIVGTCSLALAIPYIPESRLDEDFWAERHQEYINNSNINSDQIKVVFFGDSITEWWRDVGKEVFDEYYGQTGANYGIGNDRTEHVLWRVLNGEVQGLNDTEKDGGKVFVLKIGTNNFWLYPNDEEIARGILASVDALRSQKPKSKVLLLGILPRTDEEFMLRVDNVNKMISIVDNGNTVRFLNMREHFYYGNGSFPTQLFNGDLLHISPEGYAKWAEVMDPLLKEMLSQLF